MSRPTATESEILLPPSLHNNRPNNDTGKLSMASNPASSRKFNALLFPAPDMPVTMTTLAALKSVGVFAMARLILRRQGHDEPRPLHSAIRPMTIFHPDRPAVGFDDLPRNGKPKA